MTRHLNKDTIVCMSLSARPSNFGTRFHNYLYDALDLDYLYKAFATDDIQGAIAGVRALRIRGCAISMPFKEAVIPLVDELDASARVIDSVNTVVNSDGYLKAYNTDYLAIYQLLEQYAVNPELPFILQGSGGMAKAVAAAFQARGFRNGTIVARNAARGQALAAQYGYQWAAGCGDLRAAILVNATPLGMAGAVEASQLAFSEQLIHSAEVVFDVVAMPARTPLIEAAQRQNKCVITGAEVFAIQAVEQFVLYTGIRPQEDLFQAAAASARG